MEKKFKVATKKMPIAITIFCTFHENRFWKKWNVFWIENTIMKHDLEIRKKEINHTSLTNCSLLKNSFFLIIIFYQFVQKKKAYGTIEKNSNMVTRFVFIKLFSPGRCHWDLYLAQLKSNLQEIINIVKFSRNQISITQ